MFVINPDPYLLPVYRLSPFKTDDIARNYGLEVCDTIDQYFNNRFGNENYTYLSNGRAAIHAALSYYNLKKNDIVTVLTTTNNFYISGCVTSEIEKFCKWNRIVTESTKLIFVNHEFGFPYPDLEGLKDYGIPIVEDCAYSFFSEDKKKEIGNTGDFAIYSFPKMFPLQIGGLLVNRVGADLKTDLNQKESDYIKKLLSHYIKTRKKIIGQRVENYTGLRELLSDFGFTERFRLKKGIVPGVFMFRVNDDKIDLDVMKKYLYMHGIQCSVFYGERAFFIPVHQRLEKEDLMYFKEVIGSFLSFRKND